MPKVELHVHLEGAIKPSVLWDLAQRNGVELPVTTPEEIQEWFTFKHFAHFVQLYLKVSECIQTPDDIEVVARAFLADQARQHIRYSEVTYTAYTHYHFKGLPFEDQLAALNRARVWAEAELGTTMGIVLDIPRSIGPENGAMVADWAIAAKRNGVVALGLSGFEAEYPSAMFRAIFARAYAAGVPAVPHAGEMGGAESMWGSLRLLHAARIGHGVRCLEDATLVQELYERQIPLEVCPTSNVCLGVVASIAEHPLPHLLDAGLYVTINSDDPALFNTTLTDEYLKIAHAFGLGKGDIKHLAQNAVYASFLPDDAKQKLTQEIARTGMLSQR